MPVRGRSRNADDRHAARALSLCRHPLVLDDVRPRRPDHGAADAVVRSRASRAACCAASPPTRPRRPIRRPTPSPGRSCTRCASGEMAALQRGAVRPLLWQRRCDAAVRPARRPLCRAHRRSRDDRGAVAGHRGGAGLDRRAGRSRRRRLRRISPRAREHGLANQGWKDSPRRDFPRRWPPRRGPHRAGRGPGLRLCGQNGVAARSARRIGSCWPTLAGSKPTPSGSPRRFEAAFWCPELGTYALALDGAKAPCRVRTSNAGQLLFTGIAQPERAAQVASELLRAAVLFRLGHSHRRQGEARYNPMSYHNGSIWPHDNALIALGFARYGLKRSVARSFTGPVRRRDLHGSARLAGTVLRLPAPARPRADALSGRLLAAGLGERHAVRAARACARPELDPGRNEVRSAQPDAAVVPRRGDAAQSAAWAVPPPISSLRRSHNEVRPRSMSRGATAQIEIVLVA